MKRSLLLAIFALILSAPLCFGNENLQGNTLFTDLKEILAQPQKFSDTFVSVKGTFQGWQNAPGRPPVTRSDWVIQSHDGTALYCTGPLPRHLAPGEPALRGKLITVLGKIALDASSRPYIVVTEALPIVEQPEFMVSVAQVLFDPIGMRNKTVSLLGVLAKGADHRGGRMYLLADPTGALTIQSLPKLYPKGTILQIRGTIGTDENGLPQLQNVEIISAKP
jgi:hypothetical protein